MLLCDGVAAAMLGAAVVASFGWHDGQREARLGEIEPPAMAP
jgi:hypothetical protein